MQKFDGNEINCIDNSITFHQNSYVRYVKRIKNVVQGFLEGMNIFFNVI